MSPEEIEEVTLEKNKEKLRWDKMICENASLSDINQKTLRWFLKEAGKDHYQILKKKMSTLLSTAKQMNVKKVAASKSTEKLDSSNSQSGAISIFIETKSGHLIKLLYDNNLDLETWQKSTNQFLDLMESHYENGNGDPISKYLMQVSKEKSGRDGQSKNQGRFAGKL